MGQPAIAVKPARELGDLMKKIETRFVCDLCAEPQSSAEIRCDKHGLDLCTSHVRSHFDRRKCRLVLVDREPTVSEQLTE